MITRIKGNYVKCVASNKLLSYFWKQINWSVHLLGQLCNKQTETRNCFAHFWCIIVTWLWMSSAKFQSIAESFGECVSELSVSTVIFYKSNKILSSTQTYVRCYFQYTFCVLLKCTMRLYKHRRSVLCKWTKIQNLTRVLIPMQTNCFFSFSF